MSTEASPKRDAILQAATEIFLSRGYSGASMDAIAEAAPVSKATLYSHFRNKQELFAAVIAGQCGGLLDTLSDVQTSGLGVEQSLTVIANVFVDLIYGEEALSLYRLIVGECQTFPELGQLLDQAASAPTMARLTAYFTELHQQGSLAIPDPATSAKLFISLLKGHDHTRCLLGLQPPLAETDKARLVHGAVNLFLHGHAHAR